MEYFHNVIWLVRDESFIRSFRSCGPLHASGKKNLKQKPINKSWVFIYWLIWFFVGWKSMIFLCNSVSNLTINGCHLCVLLHLHTSEFAKISTCLMYNHYWLISKYQFNLIFVPFWKDVSFSFKMHFTN